MALGLMLALGLSLMPGRGALWAKDKPVPAGEERMLPAGKTNPTVQKPALGAATGLPIPRFVSLKSSKINVRRGPGNDYPVEWIFAKRGLPVEITAESNRWRRIRDRDGSVGWVWHGMLDGRRTAIVEGPQGSKVPVALLADPLPSSGITAYAESGVIAEVETCKQGWCRLKVGRYEGWVHREHLYGVYPGESFE